MRNGKTLRSGISLMGIVIVILISIVLFVLISPNLRKAGGPGNLPPLKYCYRLQRIIQNGINMYTIDSPVLPSDYPEIPDSFLQELQDKKCLPTDFNWKTRKYPHPWFPFFLVDKPIPCVFYYKNEKVGCKTHGAVP